MQLDWANIFRSRILWIVVACIAGLGLLLYILQGIDSCRFNSGVNKKKEAVNTALQEINAVQANIQREKEVEQELIANVRRDAKDHLDSINATDATRNETNKAIERMANASNTNRNVNAAELEKILEGLE